MRTHTRESVAEQSRRSGFIAASVALVAAFAASAAPIPLYGNYRSSSGLSYSDLSLTVVFYFAGAVSALLILGRLSNHLGRRPVVLLSLGLAALASLILLDVSSVAPLIVGRFLLGLACGLASSATAAFVVDNAPADPPWLGAAVSGSAPMIGLTLGALGSGALAEYGPMPRIHPYLFVLAGLLGSGCLVVMSRETVARRPGIAASLRPTFGLPRASRRLFPVASCIFVATWALGGFYQAFGPAMATDQLGSTNALISAIVFSSFIAPTPLGGPLSGRLSPAAAQRLGTAAFAVAVVGVLLSLRAAAVGLFLVASAAAGVAQGIALTGNFRALLAQAQPSERAGGFAVIYATSYCGAAVPSFLAGQAARSAGLFDIACAYGVLAVLACLVALLAARNP